MKPGRILAFTGIFLSAANPVWCFADAEMDALNLPGVEISDSATSKSTQMSVEIVTGANVYEGAKSGRMSGAAEIVWTPQVNSRIGGRFSDRWDGSLEGFTARETASTNTLREAFMEYRWNDMSIFRIGRENIKQGVGMGYNPTDYFRANAVRSYASMNPNALRANRSGTFALSGTKLWDTGALSMWIAPKLGEQRTSDPFSLDVGATNPGHALALSVTQQLTPNIKPQVLFYHSEHEVTAAGLNVNALFFKSTIAYLETSVERRLSLWNSLFSPAANEQIVTRSALGFTYTSDSKVTVTAEYDYNGDGLTGDGWNTLRAAGARAVTQYFVESRNRMDPPSRKNVFLYLSWKDVGIKNIDIACFTRRSVADDSQLYWVEGVYHYRSFDFGTRLQAARGEKGSIFGSLFSDELALAFVRAFF